jgi:hypothetical protein
MEPINDKHAIVDLIDVLLKKGAVIKADLIITVADVPLVGLSLHAVIAGMTMMQEYGMLAKFDEHCRSQPLRPRQ